MAGILIHHKQIDLSLSRINSIACKNGFSAGKQLEFGEWHVVVFEKSLPEVSNWLLTDKHCIAACGTFCYKGSFYRDSFEEILLDLQGGNLDLSEFYGTFFIIAQVGDALYVIRDGAEVFKLYKIVESPIYASSFYLLTKLLDNTPDFCHPTALELLNTGCIIGHDTIVKQIKLHSLTDTIPGIKTLTGESKKYSEPRSYIEAVEQQVAITKNYFKTLGDSWSRFSGNAPIDIGLTGGLDSRYIAGSLLDKEYSITFHTHYRKAIYGNPDYKYAMDFASHFQKPISSNRVIEPLDLDEDELKSSFEQAYRFCDGVIRPGCYWDEPYCTQSYRESILKYPYLRMIGFGGEQYRNMEKLPLESTIGLDSWVRWEMIFRFAGGHIRSWEYQQLVDRLVEKLKPVLSSHRLNLYSFKEYNRYVVSVSYRSIQTNIENKIGFCVSPYLDIQLAEPSFLAIPYLHGSFDFHLAMLRLVSPEAARFPNAYGFSFFEGEPLISRISTSIWQKIPFGIKYPIHSLMRPYHRSDYLNQLSSKNSFIRGMESKLSDLLPGLEYDKFRMVSSRAKLGLNLVYFLQDNKLI